MATTTNRIEKIVVLGGTGAQGSAVVRALTRDGRYQVRVQTRNPDHQSALELAQLPNVTFHVGHVESEELLREAIRGMDAVYLLANSFAIGEKAELHWSIRAFELARELGVKLFQFSGLDYLPNKAGYDPKFRCAHYDAKGRVSEWIKRQPVSPMKWAILTSGPYMEMMHFMWAPKFDQATSTYQFFAPLGQSGAIPMIHLDDLGEYARWVFDHPDQSAGLDLEIATAHIRFDEVAQAWTKTTGRKAAYVDVPLQAWLDSLAPASASSAHQVDASTESGVLTWHQSFTGWWNIYRHSGGGHPLISRDYKLLDKILPSRVRSIEEWMKKVGYKGVAKDVLKDRKDKNGGAGRAVERPSK